MGFAPERLDSALEKLGIAQERHGADPERLGLAPERPGFAPERLALPQKDLALPPTYPKIILGPNWAKAQFGPRMFCWVSPFWGRWQSQVFLGQGQSFWGAASLGPKLGPWGPLLLPSNQLYQSVMLMCKLLTPRNSEGTKAKMHQVGGTCRSTL